MPFSHAQRPQRLVARSSFQCMALSSAAFHDSLPRAALATLNPGIRFEGDRLPPATKLFIHQNGPRRRIFSAHQETK